MRKEADIFILIDGLGWTWIKDIPFLRKAAPYRRPLETVLGFSTAAIPSILTGRYPEEHGRLCLFQLAQEKSPFEIIRLMSAMPAWAVENRYVRHLVKRAVRRINGLEGYFQLYQVPLRHLPLLDVSEKRDIYKPGGIEGSVSIFDLLVSRGVEYAAYSYHQGPDELLMQRMAADLRQGEKTFYFIYLAQIDALLHAHADDPALINTHLARYSSALEELHEIACSRYRTVRVHVCADHGMAATRNTVDIKARLARLTVHEPEDYLCLLDSTMARCWFFSERARDQVMGVFTTDIGGRWLGTNDLKGMHAFFGDHRYGDEIYLMPEGTVIEPSHMGVKAPSGMHGFDPSSSHSYASFLSSEDYHEGPNSIVDVFSLMTAQAQ